jgi:hypothetical protein
VACAEGVPSVQRLAVHMETAMEELEAAFLAGRPKRASGKVRAARKPAPGSRSPSAKRKTGQARGRG